jgi:hypothetical protein
MKFAFKLSSKVLRKNIKILSKLRSFFKERLSKFRKTRSLKTNKESLDSIRENIDFDFNDIISSTYRNQKITNLENV